MICDLIVFPIEIVFHDLSWSDGLRVISNKSMDFNDPKEFFPGIRWSQVFDEISIVGMDFDSPKVYGYTSISDGLVWP